MSYPPPAAGRGGSGPVTGIGTAASASPRLRGIMVTMRDIAAAAGVSQATVSYALHDKPVVSTSTARKVKEVARRLNYSPNITARSLKSGRSGAIGLVLQELDKPYSSHLADTISRYALDRGVQTIIQQTLYRRKSETSILELVTSSICDGVILAPSKLTEGQIRDQLNGKPAVLLSPSTRSTIYDSVYTPGFEGSYQATSYLLAHGCNRPIFMGRGFRARTGQRQTSDSALQRVAGFEKALADRGIDPDPDCFIDLEKWETPFARRTIREVIDRGQRFDGVVCMNDTIALGVLRGLRDRGVEVPGQVGVMGFDGIGEGECSVPALSTVTLDIEQCARMAVDTLLDRIGQPGQGKGPEGGQDGQPGREGGPAHLKVDCRLTIRESTR